MLPLRCARLHEVLQCLDPPLASGLWKAACYLQHRDGGNTGHHDTPVSCRQGPPVSLTLLLGPHSIDGGHHEHSAESGRLSQNAAAAGSGSVPDVNQTGSVGTHIFRAADHPCVLDDLQTNKHAWLSSVPTVVGREETLHSVML